MANLAADWRALYPFTSRWLPLGPHELHYLDEHSLKGGPGDTLLLLHGNPTWSFYWRNVIAALRDRYRLVVPDHIGCGLSDKPQDYPYRLAQHIENVCNLVRALDLRQITLIAHDWGGAIGMGAAVAMPERFSRFVLLNSAAFRSQRIPWRIAVCRWPLLGTVAVRGLNGFVRAALRWATCRKELFTPAVRAGYLAPYDSWANRVAVHKFVLDIPLAERHPSYGKLLEIEQGLSQFHHYPVSLIWGMRDWCFTPHFLQRFQEFFPQAEVHKFAESGHFVMEDERNEVISLLEDFLQRHPQARL